jgi:hypothetical protein
MGKKKTKTTNNNQNFNKKQDKEEDKLVKLFKEKLTTFDSKAFHLLLSNFEFEYIYTFLPLAQIFQHSRVSKLFYNVLTRDELWYDLSLLHFKESSKNKDNYFKVKQLLNKNSYFIKKRHNDGFYLSELTSLNEKKIIKLVTTKCRVLALTEDHKLFHYQNIEDVKDTRNGQIFKNIKNIVDVVASTDYAIHAWSDRDHGILLTSSGKVYVITSFNNEKIQVLHSSKFKFDGDHIHIVKIENAIDGFYHLLTATGDLYITRGNDAQFSMKNIVSVTATGAINSNNEFITFNELRYNSKKNYKPVARKKRIQRAKSYLFHEHGQPFTVFHHQNGQYESNKVDHSKNIKGKILDFYVIKDNCYFKTNNGYYTYTEGKYEKYHLATQDYELLSESKNHEKVNKANLLDDFPLEVCDVFLYYSVIFQVKGTFTEKIKERYEKQLEKYRKEKEELNTKILKCKNCLKNYLGGENTDKSCWYHTKGTQEEKVNYDTYEDVYDCCGGYLGKSEGCCSRKHAQ